VSHSVSFVESLNIPDCIGKNRVEKHWQLNISLLQIIPNSIRSPILAFLRFSFKYILITVSSFMGASNSMRMLYSVSFPTQSHPNYEVACRHVNGSSRCQMMKTSNY
jgi:ABC-type anion transport system duplicated permease subunit